METSSTGLCLTLDGPLFWSRMAASVSYLSRCWAQAHLALDGGEEEENFSYHLPGRRLRTDLINIKDIWRARVKWMGPHSFCCWPVTREGVVVTNWEYREFHLSMSKNFFTWEWQSTGKKTIQRGCGDSFSGNIQRPLPFISHELFPMQPTVGNLL